MTVEEALQHRTYQDAIAGSRPARREVLKMIAKREQYLAARQGKKRAASRAPDRTADPDNADAAMLILGIAGPDGRVRSTAQLLLEPWAVQAALQPPPRRRAPHDRNVSEIERCTRDPGSLRWPRGTGE